MKAIKPDQKTEAPLASLQQHLGVCLAICALSLAGAGSLWATSGTWTNSIADGNWSNAINWNTGTIADGADSTATFSSSATRTITLDTARTLGNLTFNTSSYNLIGGNTLTLQTSTSIPTVTVNAGTTTIGVPLSSAQQILFTGGIVALTNGANDLPGGLIYQENPIGFVPGALGSGTIQVGNAPGGNNGGAGQVGFDALSSAPAGTAPVTLNNDFVIRTIRWIVGQQNLAGLNAQPIIINGNVNLDMGNANVRDLALQQNLTINGVLSGGQSGPSVFGLNLGVLAGGTLTLAGANTFVGGINFNVGSTLGVNSAAALGDFGNRINFNTAGATLRVDAPFTIPSYQGPGGIGVNVAANATINCLAGDLEIDAIVQGGATLTKSGANILTLTAANTFSGPITLSAGTLAITGSGSVNSGSITIATNSIFLLADSAAVANLAAITINNGGQFVLQGAPTLKSNAAITANTGSILDVSGVSGFTLGAGQSVIGGGVVNGSLVAASGSLLVPGTVGTAATLSFSNDLTLNGQSLVFDLRNNTTEGSGTNDEIVVAGSLTLSGGEQIYLNYLDGQLAAGTYTLIRYGVSKSGNFTLGAAYPNVVLDQTSTPGAVLLVVSGGSIAHDLTWEGDGTANVWSINSAANWVTNWANPAIVYTDPSKVIFDDSGSNSPAINLTAIVLPNAVTFSNTAKAYTVTGTGRISGAGALSLKGTNSVTFTMDNDFAGGTTFTTNGILQLGNGGVAGSVGSGDITLGSAGPKVIVNRTTPITLTRLTGTGGSPQIVQSGSGTTTLGGSADNAYLGGVVNSGTLVLGKASSGSAHALGGATTVNTGGTLQLGGSGGDQIYSGVTVTLAGGTYDTASLNEGFTALSGYGTVTDSSGGGTTTLTASPGLTAQNGALTISAGTLTLTPAANTAGINVNGTLNVNGGTVNNTVGNSTGNGVAGGGTLNLNSGSMIGNGNFYFSIGNSSAGSGVAVANFNGGTFTGTGELLIGFQKPARVTVNPGATLNLNFFSFGDTSGSCTNYLNGGLIQAAAFNTRGAGTAVNYFNGATVQAKGNRDPFINTMTHAYISTNGLILNDAGYAVSIVQGLEHDPALGATLDGGLTKLGSGTLTLKGVNTFTGGITNQAGSLQFTTQGGRTSSTLVYDNATNIIQVAARGTTVTNQSLALGVTGTGTQGLNFNLGTLGLPTAPPLNVASTLTSAGNVAVGIIAPIVPPGQAALVKYSSFNPSLFANWSVAPVPYVGLSLSNNTANSTIDLVVAPGNFPTWTAAANHTWDLTSIDWKMSLTSTPTNYFESTPPGPPVNFDDTATGASSHDVQINAQNVSPAFITMSNNQDYTFEGSYGIAGSSAIIKNGSGALILNNSGANSYSGATLVTGGSVVAGAANVLSTASDTTLTSSSLNIGANAQNIGNITLNESPLIGAGTLTGNGGALNLNSSNNAVLATPLAGTIALGKGGTGTLSITMSNSYNGATLVNAGTLRITDGAALGLGGFSAATWTVISPGGAVMMDGSLSMSEHMHISGAGPTGLGCLVFTNGDTTVGNGGAHTALDADSTIYVAANASVTNLAQYYGGLRITKSGPGLMYAASVLLNNLTVSQGTFLGAGQIGNGNALVDVSIIANSGATFGGIGPVTPIAILQAGSTCTPGLLGPGTLTFNNFVTNAANCVMEIGKTGTTLVNDQIVANSAFVFTGTVTVTNLGPDALAAGDSFKLFTLTNYAALAGVVPSLPALPTPMSWTNRLAVDGTIAVVSAVSTTPFDITVSQTAANLTLQWPSDHIGWRLLYQTNHLQGISTNLADWDVYPNSATVDQVTIPVDAAKPTEFYRMVYP